MPERASLLAHVDIVVPGSLACGIVVVPAPDDVAKLAGTGRSALEECSFTQLSTGLEVGPVRSICPTTLRGSGSGSIGPLPRRPCSVPALPAKTRNALGMY